MRIDPDGIDLGWFAVDQDGHVGFFTSQGSRVVPESVLASRETWEFLKQSIQKLPPRGKGLLQSRESGNLTDWIDMAARGLFAYDFDSHDTNVFERGDYKLIAAPSQLVIIDSLDREVISALRPLTIGAVCFAKSNVVKQDLIWSPSPGPERTSR